MLVKYITFTILPIDFQVTKGPNLANDQQGKIKIPVLPDLFKAKCLRRFKMLRLANTEKKRLPLL